MLIVTPCASRALVNAALVSCEPGSLLNISGVSKRVMASCSASTQKRALCVFDSRHAKTLRLNTSSHRARGAVARSAWTHSSRSRVTCTQVPSNSSSDRRSRKLSVTSTP